MKFTALLLSLSLAATHGLSQPTPKCGKLSKCHVVDLDSGDKLELKDMTEEMRKRRNIRCTDAAWDMDGRVLHATYEIKEFTKYTVVCEATGFAHTTVKFFDNDKFSEETNVVGKGNIYHPLGDDGHVYLNTEGNKDIRVSGYVNGRADACFEAQVVLDVEKGSDCETEYFNSELKYHILSEKNGNALSVDQGSTQDGANVIQWTTSKATNDNWIFESHDNGFFHVQAEHSKKMLHMDQTNKIVQSPKAATKEDEWCFIKKGKFFQIRNRESGLCVDFEGNSAVGKSCSLNHNYKVVPVIDTGDKPLAVGPTSSPTVAPTSSPTLSPVATRPKAAGPCGIRGDRVSWTTPVGAGVTATVSFGTKFNTRIHYDTTEGASSVVVPDAKIFDQEIVGYYYGRALGDKHAGFYIRFYDTKTGLTGDWAWCENYNAHSGVKRVDFTYPADACYLWGDRLWYDVYVPVGSTLEIIDKFGNEFTYTTTDAQLKYTINKHAHKNLRFHFKMRIKNKLTGEYVATNVSFTDEDGYLKCRNFTPIAIDLDNDRAIKIIEGTFHVDITGDGKINTLSEWFNPKDGILIDVEKLSLEVDNQVGDNPRKIDGTHMYGDQGRQFDDGFDKLIENHDYNQDGMIQGFEELDGIMLWVDANSNCMVDDGELSTLQSHGIVAIRADTDTLKSEALLEDGSTLYVEDVMFHGERRRHLRGD